jgi:hypothetical protein
LEDFVKIRGDGYFIVKKVMQPMIIVPMSEGDERQQVGQTNVDFRLGARSVLFIIRNRNNPKRNTHLLPPLLQSFSTPANLAVLFSHPRKVVRQPQCVDFDFSRTNVSDG